MFSPVNYKSCLVLFAAGLLSTANYAATKPTTITDFTKATAPAVFSVKSTSWRDPAFGNLGWTHSSQWGSINARKGKTVTITITSQVAGLHPGITVWRRDALLDTAPDEYFIDHFYPQRDGVYKIGATDEDSGADLGNIIMPIVAYGYDQDGNTKKVTNLRPIKDGVPGKLIVKFKAPETAVYQFVIGGFNPDTGVDSTVKHNVEVSVAISK